tara:strand:- start:10613 stop:10789 length:177 start_codon:yes stop_codon:yes gene_type:complete
MLTSKLPKSNALNSAQVAEKSRWDSALIIMRYPVSSGSFSAMLPASFQHDLTTTRKTF